VPADRLARVHLEWQRESALSPSESLALSRALLSPQLATSLRAVAMPGVCITTSAADLLLAGLPGLCSLQAAVTSDCPDPTQQQLWRPALAHPQLAALQLQHDADTSALDPIGLDAACLARGAPALQSLSSSLPLANAAALAALAGLEELQLGCPLLDGGEHELWRALGRLGRLRSAELAQLPLPGEPLVQPLPQLLRLERLKAHLVVFYVPAALPAAAHGEEQQQGEAAQGAQPQPPPAPRGPLQPEGLLSWLAPSLASLHVGDTPRLHTLAALLLGHPTLQELQVSAGRARPSAVAALLAAAASCPSLRGLTARLYSPYTLAALQALAAAGRGSGLEQLSLACGYCGLAGLAAVLEAGMPRLRAASCLAANLLQDVRELEWALVAGAAQGEQDYGDGRVGGLQGGRRVPVQARCCVALTGARWLAARHLSACMGLPLQVLAQAQAFAASEALLRSLVEAATAAVAAAAEAAAAREEGGASSSPQQQAAAVAGSVEELAAATEALSLSGAAEQYGFLQRLRSRLGRWQRLRQAAGEGAGQVDVEVLAQRVAQGLQLRQRLVVLGTQLRALQPGAARFEWRLPSLTLALQYRGCALRVHIAALEPVAAAWSS
jgi:hypothetical protein